MDKQKAKDKLDRVIYKSRVHFYKPIQIAEILHYKRVNEPQMDLMVIDNYRTRSRKWRDDVSKELLGSVCSSSAKYQDNLFEDNAVPPEALKVLGDENDATEGAVEAYIYDAFNKKHRQLENALDYCLSAEPKDFMLKELLDSFWKQPGLRRSIDKIYEIVVFSLFDTIVSELDLTVNISVDEEKVEVLKEFEDFAEKVMSLNCTHLVHSDTAHVYRVGIANAADRGLDMYSNWGPAIQIKHLVLDEELAESIVDSVSSDRIVIVCKAAESKLIVSLLNQIGWKSKIQSVVTEDNLIDWYEKALRGKYAEHMGEKLLETMREQILLEFPSIKQTSGIIIERCYPYGKDDFWK